jgi:hypothetical protein
VSLYCNLIMHATGCPAKDAAEIEDIMRHVVFHSTLDWQTRHQLERGAREAYVVLLEIRKQESANASDYRTEEQGKA